MKSVISPQYSANRERRPNPDGVASVCPGLRARATLGGPAKWPPTLEVERGGLIRADDSPVAATPLGLGCWFDL